MEKTEVSASVDKKKIPCKFFAKGKCNDGKGCPFSHKRTRSPSRGASPKGEAKVPCWSWIRGNCPKGKECKFHHDPKAAPKKGTSAAADSGGDKPKPKPTPKPKPKGKPGAPAVGDSFVLEESDDEGSVKMNTSKKKKVSIDDDIGDIILNEAVYFIRNSWKQVIKNPLRLDIKRYETREITDHSNREQKREPSS